jgi:hypothetical protein
LRLQQRLTERTRTYESRLHSALHAGGVAGFLREYRTLKRTSLRFCIISNAVESFIPITHLCRQALAWGFLCRKSGIGQAARELLEKWQLDVQYRVGGPVYEVLEKEAFISYGNHTSGFEHYAYDAMFRRMDTYHVGASFLRLLGPGLTKRYLPVYNTVPQPAGFSNHGWKHSLVDTIGSFIWPPIADPSAKRANAEILDKAAKLICESGSGVNIFPTGSVIPDAQWRFGIGSLVRRVLAQVPTRDIYIVPIVYGIEPTHLLASRLLPRYSVVRLLAKLQTNVFEATPYVYAPQAIKLQDLGFSNTDTAAEITERLKTIWTGLYRTSQAEFTRWLSWSHKQ